VGACVGGGAAGAGVLTGGREDGWTIAASGAWLTTCCLWTAATTCTSCPSRAALTSTPTATAAPARVTGASPIGGRRRGGPALAGRA
jgi:hypothetical protein